MWKSLCFLLVMTSGALSASLPASNNPTQNFDSFLKHLIGEIKDQVEVYASNEAENPLKDAITEVKDDTADVTDDASKVSPPGMGNVGYYYYASSTAFHAYLTSSRCYHADTTFKFNYAPVNCNNRYSVHTGIYTVPSTGYYVFTWTVAANYKSWFTAELRVNGVVKGSVMADSDITGHASGIHPATGFAIVRVITNQHVYIRLGEGHGCTVKSDSKTRSTFTGWRLY